MTRWDEPGADPLGDIRAAMQDAEEAHRAMMNGQAHPPLTVTVYQDMDGVVHVALPFAAPAPAIFRLSPLQTRILRDELDRILNDKDTQ